MDSPNDKRSDKSSSTSGHLRNLGFLFLEFLEMILGLSRVDARAKARLARWSWESPPIYETHLVKPSSVVATEG